MEHYQIEENADWKTVRKQYLIDQLNTLNNIHRVLLETFSDEKDTIRDVENCIKVFKESLESVS